jgi:dolichyl-phosphate-mannose-protein mannosyltransferase
MSRALRIAAIVWVLAISARYLGAALKALRNPFNPGYDFTWMVVSLAFMVLAGVLLRWRRIPTMGIGVILLSSLAVVIILRSGAFVSALFALWVLAATTVLGDFILSKLRLVTRENLCDRFVIAFPLGIVVFGNLALILALLGFLTPTVVWIVFIAASIAELGHAKNIVQDLLSRPHSSEAFLAGVPELPFVLLVMGFASVRNLMWTIAPEVEFDALNMRLAVPRIFLQEGRFVDLPYIWHSYFVHLLEYFNTICLALHGESVAKLVVAVIAIAAALGAYSVGRTLFSPTAGVWAAVFFYTTPLVSWGSGTAYNDNAVAQFVTAAILAFVLWYRTQHWGWIVASGLLAGGATSIKLNGVFALVGLTLALLAVIIFKRRPLYTIAIFVVLACFVAAPCYLLVYSLTGNPIFPFMNEVFKSPYWELDNPVTNASDFGVGTSPGDLLRLPFRLTLDTARFGEALTPGALGPLLLFIPFGVLALRKDRESRIVAFVMFVYLAFWAATYQYGRYYTAVLPAVAALSIGGFLTVAPGFLERYRQLVLAVLVFGQLAVQPVLYWRIPERFPLRRALGTESRESLLRRGLEGYAAAQYINRVVQMNERVLSIGHEDLRFYLKPPLETLVESRLGSKVRQTASLAPGRELANVLIEANIRYILLTTRDMANPPSYYPYASRDFLQEFATLEYSYGVTRVFHLKR